jgi:glutathione synthase/RimK-type ligase-like ATP-grasp enzyme
MVRKTSAVSVHYIYWRSLGRQSIARAIKSWAPDFLICTDDLAVGDLHSLHEIASDATEASTQALKNLIESSIGNPASFALAREKSAFILFAQAAGVRCPKTVVVPNGDALERELGSVTYPLIVKADGSWGGKCVRIADGANEAHTAACELSLPAKWSGPIKRVIGRFIASTVPTSLRRYRRRISLQQYIGGRPANRAVVCSDGKVLAGISVEAIETMSEFGPAAVIRIVDHPEMSAAAETLVGQLKLSGFVGFDFVLDSAGAAWLVEMNARVTPTSHLDVEGSASLPAALLAHMAATTSPMLRNPRIKDKMIALFPQELHRTARSEYLSRCYHDVPWEEPRLVRACLDRSLSGWVYRQLERLLRNLSNARPQATLRTVGDAERTTSVSNGVEPT